MQSNRIVFQALDGAEKAASNEPFETLYEDLVIHLDELLDSQLTALVRICPGSPGGARDGEDSGRGGLNGIDPRYQTGKAQQV